jgi:hypothetical protein
MQTKNQTPSETQSGIKAALIHAETIPVQESRLLRKLGFVPIANYHGGRVGDSLSLWEKNGMRVISTNGYPIFDPSDEDISINFGDNFIQEAR